MTPQDWKEQLDKAQAFKTEWARCDLWDRWSGYYRGNYHPDVLPYNLIFSMARTVIPNVYFRNPWVCVTPKRPGFGLQAKVLECLTNTLFEGMKLKRTIKKMILHTFLYGTGVCKLGYDSEFGYDPRFMEGDTQTDQEAARIEYHTGIQPGMPWALAVHPKNVFVPWGSKDPHDLPWVAFKVFRHIDAVKRDEKYSRKARKQVQATHYNPVYKQAFAPKSEYCLLWEISDYRTGKVYVFADGQDIYLREDRDYNQVDGLPVAFLVFNEDPEVLWGISDVHILEPQQIEENEIRTQQQRHRRLSLIKFLYDRNRISPEELEKLLSGEVGPAVGIDGPPATAVAFASPTMPQDLEIWAKNIRMDVREALGFSRNQLGEFDVGTRRTASEALIVQQAAQIRLDDRRDAVADLLIEITRKVHSYIWEYWTEEHFVQLLGPDYRTHWIAFKGHDLRGEYQYRIDPSSEIPITKLLRRQEAMNAFQLLRQHPDIDPRGLVKWLLDFFEGVNVEELLRPQAAVPITPPAPERAVPLGEAARMFEGREEGVAAIRFPMPGVRPAV